MKSISHTRLAHPLRILAGATVFLLPGLAMAHPGHYGHNDASAISSRTSGFLHNLSDPEHMLLAIAAGLITAMALFLVTGSLLNRVSAQGRRRQLAIRLAGAAMLVLGATSLIQSF